MLGQRIPGLSTYDNKPTWWVLDQWQMCLKIKMDSTWEMLCEEGTQ